MTGKVFLVGAGPGDPGLITVRGAELLSHADVVFYDGLVNPLLLSLSTGRCERTARTRSGNQTIFPQDEINRQLISEARAGHCVVRLKGGDPYVFGRGSEEARALLDADVPFEIVPGITAATAAGVYAGFSYTHRDHSSAVAFVTGTETTASGSSRVDYDALSHFPGTLVFYMGLARVQSICDRLIDSGMAPDTPSAVVSHASLPDQRVVTAELSQLADTVKQKSMRAPSLIVVGECVNQRNTTSWFEALPLFGLRIGITRAEHQSDDVVHTVVRAGGQPVLLPMIDILPPDQQQQHNLETTIDDLQSYDWLIFTSANAVREFMKQLWERGQDARKLHQLKIAVMGASTAAELERWCLHADIVPEQSGSESLAQVLKPIVSGKRCLWPAADRARNTLAELLTSAGAAIRKVVCYRHVNVSESDELRQRFSEARVDWIGISSPVIACQVAGLFPQLTEKNCSTKIVSISQLTTDAARDAGLTVHAQAAKASWTDMLRAIAVTTDHSMMDNS
ncbi:MAG: uroporphyrinogen-III C-methyltransferase [Fuerstiella sp.]|nr:uroporphyrinogen-III C-methyltransferase [Fuerstiella sp.]